MRNVQREIVGLVAAALSALISAVALAQESASPDVSSLRGFSVGSPCTENLLRYTHAARYTCRRSSANQDPDGGFTHTLFGMGDNEVLTLSYTNDGRLWAVNSAVRYEGSSGPSNSVFFEEVGKRFGPPRLIDDIGDSARGRAVRRRNGAPEVPPAHEPYQRSAWWSSKAVSWRGTKNFWDDVQEDACVRGNAQAAMACSHEVQAKKAARQSALGGNVVHMSVRSVHDRIEHVNTRLYDAEEQLRVEHSRSRERANSDAKKVPRY